jgi:hypothetical protein
MIDRLGFPPAATGAITGISDVAIVIGRATPQAGPVRAQSGGGTGSSTDFGAGGSRAKALAPQPPPDPDRPTGPPPAFDANVLDRQAFERREPRVLADAEAGPDPRADVAQPSTDPATIAPSQPRTVPAVDLLV